MPNNLTFRKIAYGINSLPIGLLRSISTKLATVSFISDHMIQNQPFDSEMGSDTSVIL